MLILLPPSEAKRGGGNASLDLTGLGFPALTAQRVAVLAALRRVSRSISASSTALRLGPSQRFEIERNRSLTSSPSMPAIDRYSGVLYDALDSSTLSEADRAFAGDHLVVHSALFGLIGAADRIPAYRLSHDSRLPGVSLKRTWREPVSAVLAAHQGIIVDLRSESYAALGPIPGRPDAVAVRVVAGAADGRRRALSHFNKTAKGVFARAMIQAGLVHEGVESLLDWAAASGFRLSPGVSGCLELVVTADVTARMTPDGMPDPNGAPGTGLQVYEQMKMDGLKMDGRKS